MRIALVTETWAPEVNGVAMTMSRLVAGLGRRGHTVNIVRPRQEFDLSSPPKDTETLVSGVSLPGYEGLQFGLPAGRLLRETWSRTQPDVVHVVTEGPLGWSAVQQARALNLPVTSSFHTNFDGYSKHYGAALAAPLVRAWLYHFHRRTLCTLAPTTALVSRLRIANIPGARLLGRGVDTELFHPARRDEKLREKWGMGANDLVVVNVGRMAPEKNLGLAARAFEAIRSGQQDARMVWVGDGPSRKALENQYPDHIFVGAQHGEALAAHYASADLFLFPSLTETYGNVVPEAMASGLGVVAYDAAAAAELIVSGQYGVTAPPGDEARFVEAAMHLARDRSLLDSCRRAAHQRVSRITWDAVVGEFESALRAAISATAPLKICVEY